MYQKMLIPLDGSELAEVVFTYAKELAGRLDIDLTLLHVSSQATRDFIPMQKAYVKRAADTVKRHAREVQERTLGKVPEKPVKVKGELVIGYPAEEILRYATENEIDLILLATHGRSGLKRWSIGSVAGKVLGSSKTPVWLVRAGVEEETPYDKWPRTTLIVPLDGSELAESVLPHVEILAKQRSKEPVEVLLLKISEPPSIPTYYGPEISGVSLNWGDYIQQETVRRRQSSEEYLAGIEKRIKANKINVSSQVIEGKANDELVDFASKHHQSVIIMATHGRSGISRLVYGSVAANLLHGITNPILMVKPK